MGGQEVLDELSAVFNLRTFVAGNTGAQAGGWFNKQIEQPEDFEGLRFRMPGLGGKALTHLGASVRNMMRWPRAKLTARNGSGHGRMKRPDSTRSRRSTTHQDSMSRVPDCRWH